MATPTLVQKVNFVNQANNGSTDRTIPLPNAVLNGNAVFVVFGCQDNAGTVTVNDDKNNSYTLIQQTDDTTAGAFGIIAYFVNITNGPSVIHVKSTSANGFAPGCVMEYENISSTTTNFKHNGNFGSGADTGATPGSITPANGDLVITACYVDNLDPRSTTNAIISSWTKPTGYTLKHADIWGCFATAVEISTGVATNPSWTATFNGTPANTDYVCVVASFTSASQGTAPSASPRLISITHTEFSYGGHGSTSPIHFQLPCGDGGDMLYAAYDGIIAAPTTFTDSVNGAYSNTGTVIQQSGGNNGFVRNYYFASPTMNDGLTATLAFTGTDAGTSSSQVMFVESVGANSFDHRSTDTGTNSSSLTFNAPAATVAATQANGLAFFSLTSLDHGSGTPDCLKAVNHGTFLLCFDLNEEVANWLDDNNNGFAWYSPPNTTAFTITWTCGVAGSGAWGVIVDFFNPPAVVTTDWFANRPETNRISMRNIDY